MTNFNKIHAEARVRLSGYATEIASYALAATWSERSKGFLKDQVRESVADARRALDDIEALLNADDEAEAA